MNESLMKQLAFLESQLTEHSKLGTDALHDYIECFERDLSFALNACLRALDEQKKEVA